MSYDTVASLQRMQQFQQSEAVAGKRIVLQRMFTGLDITLFIIALILGIPTFSISCILFFIYYFSITKTYLVKNVATGEKFKVDKQDFKQYKKEFKAKEKEVRKISDL
ncbi:Uncharacterized protein BWINRA5_04188 [Bacillus mycoides]|uniref:hypothetical protein n=1 Tax=Bacillus TaxID=1386 RepID=UPI000817EBCF|nr:MULTISPECIES: hypothetical protein [Bacillus]MBK5428576.1 hypothetical protein [Bacillus sp. TH30]QWH29945.1 hypothetical protein EXW51_19075 [Bacillus mycoides]SCB00751.1 Uncharacterized protein BWINRA5_04188 [Bacillus mycoides]